MKAAMEVFKITHKYLASSFSIPKQTSLDI